MKSLCLFLFALVPFTSGYGVPPAQLYGSPTELLQQKQSNNLKWPTINEPEPREPCPERLVKLEVITQVKEIPVYRTERQDNTIINTVTEYNTATVTEGITSTIENLVTETVVSVFHATETELVDNVIIETSTVYSTEYRTVDNYLTETVTDYQTEHVDLFITEIITKDNFITVHETSTEIHTDYHTKVVYDTTTVPSLVYTTVFEPTYIATTELIHETSTVFEPSYITSTIVDTSTVMKECIEETPRKGGYGK